MKAAGINGFLRIHSEVDDVHDCFEHSVDNRPPARTAGNHEQPPIFDQDGWRHAR
jgi:hypothetical protein